MDIIIDIVLDKFFFILSNTEINFLELELNQRLYTTIEALSTTKLVKLVEKKEFVIIALNLDGKTFVIYIAFFASTNIYSFYIIQIILLIQDKVPIFVLPKYANILDIFSLHLAINLLKHIGINDLPNDIVKDQQLSYKPIYTLRQVEFEILKTYIEINRANGFIKPFKSFTGTSILFVQKHNEILQLCIDY